MNLSGKERRTVKARLKNLMNPWIRMQDIALHLFPGRLNCRWYIKERETLRLRVSLLPKKLRQIY